MAIKINFAPNNLPEMPTFVLTTRSGRNIGSIIPYDINFHDEFGQYSSFSFTASKSNCAVWDELTDFKLIYHKESDEFYEINVELSDSNSTVKIVTATSLGYAELSQIKLYEIEINTEDDIARDDYVVTTLYNEEKTSGSLLHRITEKCPHYSISHVDASIADIQRTFTFDGVTVMDAFNSIAEEIDCVFILNCGRLGADGIRREISVYDLESSCNDCGKRTTGIDTCEFCGSRNITPGYGEDTTILVTTDNLTDEIRLSIDAGAVKNCFRLEGGDDYMTATIRNCNPNGSDYIWYINDDTRAEMSEELREKLSAYDELYNAAVQDRQYQLDDAIVASYNELVDKYSKYNADLSVMPSTLTGYSSITNGVYDALDFNLFLSDSFMPSVVTQDIDASTELAKLTEDNLSPIAVNNISSASLSTVNSTIESVIKITVDGAYKPEIIESSYERDDSKEFGTWIGRFRVTNYSDEEDSAESDWVVLTINGDTETFLRQRINRAINQSSVKDTDIVALFNEELDEFKSDLTLYCLAELKNIYEACRACIDVMVEHGVADNASYPVIYTDIYVPYLTRLRYAEDEIQLREKEIAIIAGTYDVDGNLVEDGLLTQLQSIRTSVAEELDFEAFLGERLWKEFAAYRREDLYSNSNYISDGLSNAEVFAMAREFIETAQKELTKAATMQHSITSTLHNLLAIKEFAPITEHFATGNWIRIRVDGVLYKLRLLSYDIDFSNLANISVSFSDVRLLNGARETYSRLIQNLSSMSSSYGAVMRQASKGSKSQDTIASWQDDGLSLASQKIVSDTRYQDVVYDERGILLRKYIPETGEYDAAQVKIINQGLYVTDNNWETARAGVGYFTYYDPYRQKNVTAYGVVADTIVGDLILSRNVRIYNETGQMRLDSDGFVATNSNNSVSVRIRPNDTRGIFVITSSKGDILTVDGDGNLTMAGYVTAASFNSAGVIVDTDGFKLYGEVPVYQSATSADAGLYFGYSSNISAYTGTSGDDGMIIRNTEGTCAIAANSTTLYIVGGTGGIHMDGTVYIGDVTLDAYIKSVVNQ